MLPIEQAFIQVRFHTGHWTANVLAATDAVPLDDLSVIVDWFSAPENELLLHYQPWNLFFHPLPSGYYALGIIYSARQSLLTFLQSSPAINVRVFFVSPQTLLDFQNHPIAIFETLRNQGKLPLTTAPPAQLLPLFPISSPFVTNVNLLETLAKHPGEMSIAQLIQSLFNAEFIFFTSRSAQSISVLTALFDLLPIRYRLELTFSTNLFFSLKHSFRLSGFSGLRPQSIRLVKRLGIPIMFLEKEHRGSVETLDPWARFIYLLLQSQKFDFWEQYLGKDYLTILLSPPDTQPIHWANLHELGVVLSKAMLSGTLPEENISAADIPVHTLEELRVRSAVDQLLPMMPVSKTREVKPKSPQRLAERFPLFCDELSSLEAYLVRGIFGDESVLPQIKKIWEQLLPQFDQETKEIIREEIVKTIHAVLSTFEGESGQRLRRSTQLLGLMVFFLQESC